MKKSVLITIIVIAVIILGFVLYSAYQGIQLQDSLKKASLDSITANAEELGAGNCSKVADIENTIQEIKSSCKNPALKYVIENKGKEMGQENICEEINNPNNEYLVKFEKLKQDCSY